jgi:hypothetical protein
MENLNSMKKHQAFIFLFLSVFHFNCLADFGGYNQSNTILIETEDYIVFHYHDYTYRRESEQFNVWITGKDAIFNDSLNTYSFIVLMDKKSRDTIFRKPCPALTDLLISENGKYIIGLSKIKYSNPYHLVIYDMKGELIFKKEFNVIERKLSPSELTNLVIKFPQSFSKLIDLGSISISNNYFYIDYLDITIRRDSILYNYLRNLNYDMNHSFPHMGASVSNWVNWYNLDSPVVEIVENSNGIEKIIILDDEGIMRPIIFANESLTLEYFEKTGLIDENFINSIPKATNEIKYKNFRKEPSPYLQFGNLTYYYATIDEFCKQDSLRFISGSDSFPIASFSILVLYKNGHKSFKNNGAAISNEIIDEIRKIDIVYQIYFEGVYIYFNNNGEQIQKRIASNICYDIIKY